MLDARNSIQFPVKIESYEEMRIFRSIKTAKKPCKVLIQAKEISLPNFAMELHSCLLRTPLFFSALILLFCCFFRKYHRRRIGNDSPLPTNWPVFGMLPAVLRNAYRVQDYGTEVLAESGGTFEFKGPWFANLDMIFTCDPANIHYILTKNFSNYPKGPEYRKIFDIFGDGIFNTDSELWGIHRKVTLSVMHNSDFLKLLEDTVLEKLEKGLFPVLENSMDRGEPIDLQDLFQRFAFDNISRLVLDYDPNSLSLDLPNIPCEKAFNDTIEALLQRHLWPESCWKLQKWLNVGKERKLSQAWRDFDEFIYPCIQRKKRHDKFGGFDGFTAFAKAYESSISEKITDVFLRDAALNLMLAGRDTTSTTLTWFFFLVAQNPTVEAKILEEMRDHDKIVFSLDQAQKLVYLHGALCETLRLYPPVALEHKAPMKHDDLPSGISINPDKKVILFFYSMARMESIWGQDCMEFKPERWILKSGRIKHEPSFKFPAFNAGPRLCLGKEMSFVQMKMVAASILRNFRVKLLVGHPVSPSDSIVIQMKHGLKVMISRRI